MATNNTLTLNQIMQQINANVYLNSNTPTQGSNDWNLYLALINTIGINTWENEQNTLWNELWTPAPTFTIAAGMTTTPLPSDFKFIAGGTIPLTLVGSTTASPSIKAIPVKMLPEIVLNPIMDKREFYVTGNPVNGYELQLGWTPQTGDAEIGATANFYYYKHAATLANPNDTPEMSDPMFIVYSVCASIMGQDINNSNYERMQSLAETSLLNMTILNNKASNFMDDYIKDVEGLMGQSGNPQLNKFNSSYWTRGN